MFQALQDIVAPIKTGTMESRGIQITDKQLSSSPETSITSTEETNKYIDKICYGFVHNINEETLSSQSDNLFGDFNESLRENSSLSMLPNYKIDTTGEEYGEFLVIDLGGSTLRVAIIQIEKPNDLKTREDRINIVIENKWTVHNDCKVIDRDFFKWMGSKVLDTINAQNIIHKDDLIIRTGLTWSFSLETLAHNSGKMTQVSKGYTLPEEMYEQDLKHIIEIIFNEEYDLNVDVNMILNDSLAVYAAGSFFDPNMKLALVLGTGINCCCSLSTSQIHTAKSLNDSAILVNAEMSFFGQGLIKDFATKYDCLIDDRFKEVEKLHFKSYMTMDPLRDDIFQPSELMTSGRYLPELTRLAIMDLIEYGEICQSIKNVSVISKRYEGFTGELMCFIDETNEYHSIISRLHEEFNWSVTDITFEDVAALKQLVGSIIKRAAFIVAITIIAFMKLLKFHSPAQKFKVLKVGYVGSVLTYFTNYRNMIRSFVNESDYAKAMDITMDFKSIDNSSIIGAAIGAAAYSS